MLWQGSGERTTAGSAQTKGRAARDLDLHKFVTVAVLAKSKSERAHPFIPLRLVRRGKAKRQEILGSETSRLREPGEATGGSAVHTPISGDSFVFQTMGKVLRKG